MNTVITINLNGRAYQVESAGHDLLKSYLDAAKKKLGENPDQAEIMNDLEQAIADKARRFLSAHKDVLLTNDVEMILAEMGPVEADEMPSDAHTHHEKSQEKAQQTGGKKLYLIREGAYLTGVCNGLAAYFNFDVTLVRLAFVLLAILTHGVWILVYIVMSFVVPYATTPEEKATAHGQPFNAQELIARAKEKYAHIDKEYLREHKKEWKNGQNIGRKK